MSLKGRYLAPLFVHQSIYLDKDFSTKEIVLIKEAVNEWNIATKGAFSYKIIENFDVEHDFYKTLDKNPLVLYKIKSYDEYITGIDQRYNSKTLAVFDTRYYHNIIVIVEDRLEQVSADYYRSILMHEFGHSVGLEHSLKPNTIMYPFMDKSSSYITTADIDSFCQIYYCLAQNFKIKP